MDQLLSMDYADQLRALIDPYKTFDDPKHYGAVYSLTKDAGTSHISIFGPQGDAVSITTSINLGYTTTTIFKTIYFQYFLNLM